MQWRPQLAFGGGIAVLPGNGDGTFGTGVTLGSTSATGPILAGDFNGDGKLDLIYYDSATVLVLGNGDGTFGSPTTVSSTLTPVLTADFNGDGKLDLILQSTQGALSILLGNGNGTFGAPSTVSSTSGPTTTGDFNGDGKLDLAIFENGGVTVLLGNGDGTFQPGISTTAQGSLIGVGDFNLDGISDLAVGNSSNLSFDILYGNGDGTFREDIVGWAPAGIYPPGPAAGAAADMNGDGIPDLAVLSSGLEQTVSVLIGQTVIGIYPSPVAFPDTAVGSTSTLNVTLSNPAVGQLAVSSIAVSLGFTQTNNCPQTLSPAASCTVTLTFSPTTTGTVTGSLTITDSSPTSPQTIAVTATGGAEVTLSPTSLTFGDQLLNTTSPAQTITLTNSGVVTADITSISSNSVDFKETTICGSTLAPGASCTISVTFTPSVAGARTGSISIIDNAAGSPQVVALTGTGMTPAPVASFSPASLSFGSQPVGTSSATQKVTLTNTGSAALNITSITASADFAIGTALVNPCKGSIAVGASCTITLLFEPKSAGTINGTVTVADNAAGSPQSVALTGTGTQPAVALAPGRLSFAAELTGQGSIASAVSLTNSGTAPLAISSISIGGADTGDFSQQNNCGSSVPAGATCTINVSFKPTSGGGRSATLNVTDNAPASPQSVALTGTASDFTLGVASGSSGSATVAAGQSATYRLSAGPVGNLSGSVSLACTGAPTAATCSVSPSSVPVGLGVASQPIVVTVSTTARSKVPPRWPKLPSPGSWPLSTWWLIGLVSLAALTMLLPVRRAAQHHGMVHSRPAPLPGLLVLLACLALSIPACGGGGSTTTTTTSSGTPAGTYTLTVTGTYRSGSVTVKHSTSLSLTVQ